MTNITIRVDETTKKQAEELFAELGLNMTTAMNVFLKQSIRAGKIPFEISRNVPNSETVSAIEEVQRLKEDSSLSKSYTNIDEMMKELLT